MLELALWGKRLELLAEAVPKTRTVLFVSTQTAWDGAGGKATRETAQKLGISLILAPVSVPINETRSGVRSRRSRMTKPMGLCFSAASEFYAHRLLIVALVQQVRHPCDLFLP